MKKILLTLLILILSSAAASAQNRIQDTFLGIKLGSDYTAVCRSDCFRNEFSGHNRWTLRDYKRYKRESMAVGYYHRLIFGGYYWDEARFYFTDAEVLYKVRFYTPYTDRQSSEERYNEVRESLQKRYGGAAGISMETDDVWDDDDAVSVTYSDGQGRSCVLSCELRKSQNGKKFYYVFLRYEDSDVKINASYLEDL